MEFHGHHSERFFSLLLLNEAFGEDTWRILMRHLIIQRKFQIQILLSGLVLWQDLFCHSIQGSTQLWGHVIGFSNLIYHHEKNFLKIECE